MMIRKAFKVALIVSCWAIVASTLSACDADESILASADEVSAARIEAEVSAAEWTFDWDAVPLPDRKSVV